MIILFLCFLSFCLSGSEIKSDTVIQINIDSGLEIIRKELHPDENGLISLPYLEKKIKADGKTADEISKEITQFYIDGEIFRNPLVNVIMKNIRSVMLRGAVSQTGNIRYDSYTELIETVEKMIAGSPQKAVFLYRDGKALEKTVLNWKEGLSTESDLLEICFI